MAADLVQRSRQSKQNANEHFGWCGILFLMATIEPDYLRFCLWHSNSWVTFTFRKKFGKNQKRMDAIAWILTGVHEENTGSCTAIVVNVTGKKELAWSKRCICLYIVFICDLSVNCAFQSIILYIVHFDLHCMMSSSLWDLSKLWFLRSAFCHILFRF